MESDIKYIDLKEFVEQGFLQEANRLFFHPLGLALQVTMQATIGDNVEVIGMSVWDYRDDAEGIIFDESTLNTDEAVRKTQAVSALRDQKRKARIETLGYYIQPVQPIG